MAHKTMAQPTKAAIDALGEDHFKDHLSGHVALSAHDTEQAQLDAIHVAESRIANAAARVRKEIMDALAEIDSKSIRAIRAGDTERIAALEAEAIILRGKL